MKVHSCFFPLARQGKNNTVHKVQLKRFCTYPSNIPDSTILGSQVKLQIGSEKCIFSHH